MPGRAALLGLLTLQAVAFTVTGLVLWRLSGRPNDAFVSFHTDEIVSGIALAGVLVGVAYAAFKGLPRLSERLVRAQADNFAFLEKPLPLWAIVMVSLGAGIGEEALFRAGVQTLASDYVGVPLAIGIASALFAIVHLAKSPIAMIIFAIGVLFGYLYWISGSLLTVMIAHALYDVFALWYVQKEMHRLGVFAPKEGADES
ncbi:CPBP family intramembrane glutamic endopeptidase [Alteriqipengyuania lutimaris]|uniref:CPBP family intramembrane metalloprotease n=1 Tax=Alteriqipengyuania lutimaris TaxID=1538146 RepID=A0A395LMJ0_9SPHN|nr:CPBP family intramembrane glutamic endopeptidase [Alteriqipengyuania lutimaris]MBB3032946.1 hypothetical protein [Alteriqipengyuania lutimaris]RDS77975.1 CPBP family intramembrane metalloprotease [Alteriqipengyuania lutimaris]